MSWWEQVVEQALDYPLQLAGIGNRATEVPFECAVVDERACLTGMKTGGKVDNEIVVKKDLKQAARQGARVQVGFRAAGKELTKKPIKKHVKKYLKKEISEAIEDGIDEYLSNWQQRDEIIAILLEEEIGLSRSEFQSLCDSDLFKLLQYLTEDSDDEDSD